MMQFGLIGGRLAHSYSCEIHAKIADYQYELLELSPEELEPFMCERNFKAINVTIPYKEKVIPYLDEISDDARLIGAVNTIVNRGGRLCGYNTDFYGMCAQLRHMGADLNGKKVIILGTGGTSKTANAVAKSMGAKNVITVSRKAADGVITYDELSAHADTQFIINATPVGMYPKNDGVPVDISAFPKLEGVFDVIYNPLRTNLVLDALSRGIPAEGGLFMLSAQAVYASALFRGIELDEALNETAFSGVFNDKQNIVLIGMPSSGKTTVGKALAELTGKRFVDSDDEIIKKIGQSIPDFFEKSGEEAFRKIETEVIAEISKGSGQIIATGGGAVLNSENVRRLKQNGIVIFLDRDLDKLQATSGRPLTSSVEKLKKIYETRYEIYKNSADVHIEANGTPEAVAELVIKGAIK